jgi:hypothetical protein
MTDTHDTTPQADTPRLNPPETAPKDGKPILARFDRSFEIFPAVWCGYTSSWRVCHNCTGEDKAAWWETDWDLQVSLRGWLPWPEVTR